MLLQVSPGCFEVKDGPEQLNSLSRWLPSHTHLVTSLVIEDSRFAAATKDSGVWQAGLASVLSQLPGLQSLTMRSPDSRYANANSYNDGDCSGTCHAPVISQALLGCIRSMSQLTYLEVAVLPPHGTYDTRKPPDTTLPSSLVTANLTYKMGQENLDQFIAKYSSGCLFQICTPGFCGPEQLA